MRTLLFSFSSFEAAALARDELVRSGLERESVHLRAVEDEAGPVEGNFLVGNGRALDGSPAADPDAATKVPYPSNFERTVWRGTHLLQVAAAGEPQLRTANEVARRHGGLAVEDRAGAAGARA